VAAEVGELWNSRAQFILEAFKSSGRCRISALVFLILPAIPMAAQQNETVLFGFQTDEGDAWLIAADEDRDALVIRWMQGDSVVLELVDFLQDAETLFSYGF
jgi:hypothetical protein